MCDTHWYEQSNTVPAVINRRKKWANHYTRVEEYCCIEVRRFISTYRSEPDHRLTGFRVKQKLIDDSTPLHSSLFQPRHPISVECHRFSGSGRLNQSSEAKSSGVNGDKKKYLFPVRLATVRISNLPRLIHALVKVTTLQTCITWDMSFKNSISSQKRTYKV